MTGDRLKITLEDEDILISLSVIGDITGLGLINNDDVLKGYQILRKETKVLKEYELATDINKDGKVKILLMSVLH